MKDYDEAQFKLEVDAKLYQLTKDFSFDKVAPNPSLVEEVFSLDAATIDAVSNNKLAQYCFVLGQYLITLRYNQNLIAVNYLLADKSFEHQLKIAMLTADSKLKTLKEKRDFTLVSNADLQLREKQVLAIEAEKVLLDGMVDAVTELLNALKKERSSRGMDGVLNGR